MESSDFNYTVGFTATEEIIKHLQESVKNMVVEREFIPKHIIHNRKTGETLVIWKDGTRTTVKPMMGVPHNPYSAFTAALAKKVYGSNTKVNKIVGMTCEPVKRKERLNDVIESMGDEE